MLAPGYDSEIEFAIVSLDDTMGSAAFRMQIREGYFGPVIAERASGTGISVSGHEALTGADAGKWKTTLRVSIPGAMSKEWGGKTLYSDLVRTDGPSETYLGVKLTMSWPQTFTRPAP